MAARAELADEIPVDGGWRGRNAARGRINRGANDLWYTNARRDALVASRQWYPYTLTESQASAILRKRRHDPEGAAAARVAANVEESKKANQRVNRESEPAPEAAGKTSYAIGLGKGGKGRKKKASARKVSARKDNIIGTTLSGGVIHGPIQHGGMKMIPQPRIKPVLAQMGGFVAPEDNAGSMRSRSMFGNLIMY